MPVSKTADSTWRRDYSLHMATGAVLSLSFVLIAASLSFYRSEPATPTPPPPEVVDLKHLPPPTKNATPPPPARPMVPKVVVNETIIAPEEVSFDPDVLPIESEPTVTSHKPPEVREKSTEREPFVVVEEMPEPKGGMKALYENLEYPARAQRAGVEGKVSVRFTVLPDGSVTDVIVQKSANSLLNDAAIRAIKKTAFLPGRQRSRRVPVRMTIPITFKLQ